MLLLRVYPSLYDSIDIWSTDSEFQTKEQIIKESLSNFVDKTQKGKQLIDKLIKEE